MQQPTTFQAGLYHRLSKDDERQGESVSIETYRSILTDCCLEHSYTIYKEYIDDGYSVAQGTVLRIDAEPPLCLVHKHRYCPRQAGENRSVAHTFGALKINGKKAKIKLDKRQGLCYYNRAPSGRGTQKSTKTPEKICREMKKVLDNERVLC